jgi:hypothetical protein
VAIAKKMKGSKSSRHRIIGSFVAAVMMPSMMSWSMTANRPEQALASGITSRGNCTFPNRAALLTKVPPVEATSCEA